MIRAILEHRLEQSAFVALFVLALTFAFESIRPVLILAHLSALTTVEVLIYIVLALWLASHLLRRRLPPLPRAITGPIALWLALLALAALLALDYRESSFRFVARMAQGVLVGWAAYDLGSSRFRWRLLVRALALGGLLVALLALAEAARIAPVVAWLAHFKHAPTTVGDLPRASSTLPYATITSMVIELTIPLLAAWMLTTRRLWQQLLLATLLLVTVGAMVLTYTRAGILAVLVALLFMSTVAAWGRVRPVVNVGILANGALIATVALALLTNNLVGLRLVTETEQSWYQAGYQVPAFIAARKGEHVTVPVDLINQGVRAWEAGGQHPFALSYHLYDSNGSLLTYDGPRTALLADVPPGATARVNASIVGPPMRGDFLIEWDMVQEEITWFSWKQSEPVRTVLSVAGRSAEMLDWSPSQPPEEYHRLPRVGRLTLWQAALQMVRDRPLLGVGPDNFRLLYGKYLGMSRWDPAIHTNNLYLEWLSTTGILGLLAFCWLSWCLARLVASTLALPRQVDLSGRNGSFWIWQLALAASLVAWYVHGMFDYFFSFTPAYVAFWLVAALSARAATEYEHHW
jgi:hypothetical protein